MLWLLLLTSSSFCFEQTFSGQTDTLLRAPMSIPSLAGPGLSIAGKTEAGCSFTICLQHLLMPLPDVSSWTQCSVLVNVAESNNVTKLVPGGLYYVAMKGPGSCAMLATLTGNECRPGQYFIGGKCQPPQSMPSAGTVLVAGAQVTFQFAIPQPFPYALAAMVEFSSPNAHSEDSLTLLGRERDVPQQDDQLNWVYDWNSTSSNQTLILQIDVPRTSSDAAEAMIYFFTLLNPSSASIRLTSALVKAFLCPIRPDGEQPVGLDCATTGTQTAKKLSLISHNEATMREGWWYGVFSGNGGPFSLGMLDLSSFGAPEVYFRFGNIPTLDSYDLLVPAPADLLPNFYETNLTAKGTWFIGVFTKDATSRSRGLWFNSDCAVDDKQQQCSNNGECFNHTCKCVSGQTYFCSFLPIAPTPGEDPDDGQKFWWILGVVGTVCLGCVLFAICKCRKDNRKSRQDYLTMPRASQEGVKKRTYDSMTVGAL